MVRDAGCRQYLYADDVISSLTGDAPTRQYTSRFTGSMGSVSSCVKAMHPDSTMTRKSDWPNVVRAVSLPNGSWCLRNANELLVYRNEVLEANAPLHPGRSTHLFGIGDHVFYVDQKGALFRIDPPNGSSGAAAAPAVDVASIMSAGAQISVSAETPTLAEDPTDDELIAFAIAHPKLQPAIHIFKATVVEAKKL